MKTETEIFRSDDSKKLRVLEGLRLISPAAASFYRDACRIMEMEEPFESTTHLVAHLIREIESSLRWALEPYKLHSQQTEFEIREAKGLLEKAGVSKSDPLAKAWLRFVETLGASHKDDIKALLRGLEIPENDPTAVAWLRLARDFHDWAHRDNLEPPRPMDQKFSKFWDQITDIFSVVLEKLVSQYLNSFNFLDELLTLKVPTKKDAKKLRLNVPNNPATYGYFFHRLNDSAWLPLLSSQKFFVRPIEPIYERRDEGYMVSYPPWPQSRYLARMATSSDEAVQEQIVKITQSIHTENISIHQDLLDVANALPASRAATVAKHESAWIAKQTRLDGLLPEKLGELLVHLSEGGQGKAAIDLARTTLAVLPNPRAYEEKEEFWSWHREPLSRLGGWYYGRVLQLSLPALVRTRGLEAIEMFCDLLETAINLFQEQTPVEDTDDYSDTWRPDIDHRRDEDVKDYLASAVVKSATQLAKAKLHEVPLLVSVLEAHPWRIFRRISFHILRVAPENREIITRRLIDPHNQDPPLAKEYIALLRDHIDTLTDDQKDEILTRLTDGVTATSIKKRHEFFSTGTLTDEEIERAVKRDKGHRLAPLYDVLPTVWKTRYDQWVQDTVEPQLANPEQQTAISVEPIRLLESKSIADIIEVLANPVEGVADAVNLAAELESLVESEPERLGKKAAAFKDLEPIFVVSFLSGVRRALEGGKSIPWRQVFTLLRSALKQRNEERQNVNNDFDQEETSSGVRSVVALLLVAGFKEGNAEIPFSLRKAAWRLLRPFTDDPQPTPEEEQSWGVGSDLTGRSLNTVRGNAMHTVMYYALWVQRHLKEEGDGNEHLAKGFEVMPEVRKVLEFHLNPTKDPSLVVRSVFGHWLPNLVTLDEKWLKQNLLIIFPLNEDQRELHLAAWGAYLRAWDVYNNIFNALSKEYGRAIDRLGEEMNDEQNSFSLDQRLAEHLIRTYGYGNLTLDDPEGLLVRFYAKASDRLCAHAFWHVGYNFHELRVDVHPKVLERFQKLWEKRLSAARTDPNQHNKEMSSFGYLFYSAKFDDAWAIRELKNALEISKWAEPSLFVVQRLAKLAPTYPGLTVQCLAFMAEGIKEEGLLFSWGLPIRAIISAARQSNGDNRQIAIKLVHQLGAHGHTEFRDLL